MVADSLLPFYLTGPQTCSYIPENQSYSLFLDPEHSLNLTLYSQLSQQGFRRSGNLVYRPHCKPCQACIPIRVLVDHFKANRSQKRNWKANANLEITSINGDFYEEHFALYSRYLNARHSGGEMADSMPEDYRNFLLSNWSTTQILEVREKGTLLAGIVSDHLDDGLSAVYTYIRAYRFKQRTRKICRFIANPIHTEARFTAPLPGLLDQTVQKNGLPS